MTDWENRYQLGDMPWEKGEGSPPLRELIEKGVDWGEGSILVPGCGFGHDVRILAALKIPVIGVDLAQTAVSRAREFQKVADESYELGNFLAPEWRAGRKFSAVWEHTCFCAIDPVDRGRYAEVVASCLVEGGLLAGVFFLNPFDADEASSGPPFGVTIEELETWFSPWFIRIDGWVPKLAFPGRNGREWIGLFRKMPHA